MSWVCILILFEMSQLVTGTTSAILRVTFKISKFKIAQEVTFEQ